MLLFNLPPKINHPQIAKGVDLDKTKVVPPQPMFQQRPFDNFQALALGPTDESLMGYGPQGTFTATSISVNSRNKAMAQMGRNASLVNLVNDRRRRNF